MNPTVNLKAAMRGQPPRDAVKVLNRRYGPGGWLYVGRGNQRYDLPASSLCNPYSHLPHAAARRVTCRDAAVEAFRRWLWQRLQAGDQSVLAALASIRPETVLVCWCAPEPCHAEVIARAAAWVRARQRARSRNRC